MPLRCESCGFLCAPDTSSACVVKTPCPAEGIVVYCGIVCRENDAERHARKHHVSKCKDCDADATPDRHPTDGRPACYFFLRGYCAFGNRCRKWHPERARARAPAPKHVGSRQESGNFGVSEEPTAAATIEAESLREAAGVSEETQDRDEEEEAAADAKEHEPLLERPSSCEMDPGAGRENFSNCDGDSVRELDEDTAAAETCNVAAINAESDTAAEQRVSDASASSRNEERATQTTKKSRLWLRREARKTRKSLRKKTLKQILGEPDGGVEIISEELSAEVDDSLQNTAAEEALAEAAEEALTEAAEDAAAESREVVEVMVCQESFDEVRVMTKRERKREERRLANALKKRERQERNRREESEQRSKQRANVEEGKNLLEEGKHLEAAIAFSKAMTGPNMTPEEKADLYLGRSECHLALEKVSFALRDSRTAVGLWNDDRARRSLLRLEILCGMTTEARETCGRVTMSTNTTGYLDAIARIETAFSQFEQQSADGLWKGADKEIRAAAELAPHSVAVLLGRAEVCMHLHHFEEGREFIREAKRNSGNEDDCGFLYVRGLDLYYTEEFWRDADKEPAVLRAFAKTRNWKERAMAMYHKAAAIKSRFISVQKLLNDGAKKEAIEILQSLITMDKNNFLFQSDAQFVLATIHKDNDPESAINLLNVSIGMKETTKARVERGRLHKYLLRFDEAVTDFEAALRLEPGDQVTKRLLSNARRLLHQGQRREMQSVRGIDLYGILGVTPLATTEDIKKAFQTKAKEFHPDKHLSATENERKALESRMKLVSRAFNILSNDKQREAYDRQRKRSSSSDLDSDFSEDDLDFYFESAENAAEDEDDLNDLFYKLFYKVSMPWKQDGPDSSEYPGKRRSSPS